MASANQSTFTASQVCQLLCDESGDEIDASDIEIEVIISDTFITCCLNFLCSMAKMAGVVVIVSRCSVTVLVIVNKIWPMLFLRK